MTDCRTGTSPSPNNLDCIKCAKGCLECIGPSPNNCTICESGFTLSLLTAAESDLPSTPSGRCKRDCLPSHYLLTPEPNECRPCHPSCDTCNGPTADSCLTCKSNQYKVANNCFRCHPKCLTCSGPSPFQCLTCTPPATLESSTKFCRSSATCAVGQAFNYNTDVCSTCHPTC